MSPILGLMLVVVLIAANGLFVAAEFAYVAVRRGPIEEAAREGDARARSVLLELTRLSFVLSGAQFGITATSLLVGFLAEPAVAALLEPVVEATGVPEGSALAVSLALAFALSTVAQMIFGELAPKNLAIARPERVSRAVVRFTRGYGFVLGPVIRVFDRAAAGLSRFLGVEVREELLGTHDLDDLSRIIAASGQQGALSAEQTALLTRAIALTERRVHEVIVPRPDVVWLDEGASLLELRDTARRSGHSRFPVKGVSEDDLVGTVHVKDLLDVPEDRRAQARVGEVVSPCLIVPESAELRHLLTRMRNERRTFAVAVDEYGGVAGIVTMEDVLEELVGDIEDEFDRDLTSVRRVGAGRYVVHGHLRIDRLAETLDIEVPEGDFETVAGFVLHRLGRIPDEGDGFLHDGWWVTVTAVDGVRVAEVRFERRPGTVRSSPQAGGL